MSLTIFATLGNILELRFLPLKEAFLVMEIRPITISTPTIKVELPENLSGKIKSLSAKKSQLVISKTINKMAKLAKPYSLSISKFIKRNITKTMNTLSYIFSNLKKKLLTRNSVSNANGFERKKRSSGKKYLKAALTFAVVLIVAIGIINVIGNTTRNSTTTNTEVKGALSSQDINKELKFPIRDSEGEEVSQIKYIIQKAELRDEIIVKGQKASAVKGRAFLILTLKIINEYNQPIEIETRDYARMSVNGNQEEWLAPDIHNDPVEVQAISTKFTRLGFAINDSDKNLLLRIGEIDGDKEKVELNLK